MNKADANAALQRLERGLHGFAIELMKMGGRAIGDELDARLARCPLEESYHLGVQNTIRLVSERMEKLIEDAGVLKKAGEQTMTTRTRELQEFLTGVIGGLVSDGCHIADVRITRSTTEVEPKAGEWKRSEPGNQIFVSATFEKRRGPRE